MFKYIPLSRGLQARVDFEDFEEMSQYRWHAVLSGGRPYAVRKLPMGSKPSVMYMHRQLMNSPKGYDVDHLNGDPLDNTRKNLRVCTRSQNLRNSSLSIGKGVQWDKVNRKWFARISHENRPIFLGRFQSREEAEMRVSQKRMEIAEMEATRPKTGT